MNTQQAGSRIISNWKSPEQTIAIVNDNGSRKSLLQETDNPAFEDDYITIDEHARRFDKSINF